MCKLTKPALLHEKQRHVLRQVWTLRDGKEARMDMYSDSGEALEASGLEKHPQK
jgi:hypothetical protein